MCLAFRVGFLYPDDSWNLLVICKVSAPLFNGSVVSKVFEVFKCERGLCYLVCNERTDLVLGVMFQEGFLERFSYHRTHLCRVSPAFGKEVGVYPTYCVLEIPLCFGLHGRCGVTPVIGKTVNSDEDRVNGLAKKLYLLVNPVTRDATSINKIESVKALSRTEMGLSSQKFHCGFLKRQKGNDGKVFDSWPVSKPDDMLQGKLWIDYGEMLVFTKILGDVHLVFDGVRVLAKFGI